MSLWLTFTCAAADAGQSILNIAAASNLTYVMPEIIEAFEKGHNSVRVRLSLSSTGSLYTQIRNGAPYDIYLAADEKMPALLYKDGLAEGEPFTYARGSLVLWSSRKTNFVEGVYALSSAVFKRIALANPRHAPYGEAARQVLEDAGLWEVLKPRFIFGENISQTAQFVQSGSAQAGFIAESMLKNPAMQGGSAYHIPDGSHRAIMQRGVILKRGGGSKEAAFLFRDFLFSERAREIFQRFGYGVD